MTKRDRKARTNKRFALNALAVIVSTFAAIVVLGAYLQIELTQNMRQSTELTFSAVYDAVNNEFDEITNICDSVRSDPFLIEAIEHEEDDLESFHAKMTSYLASGSERYGLSTMYVVTDKDMRYYLPDGSVKVLDPEHDDWDSWYTALIESGDEFHVDVDVDRHNTNKWTIFLDWRIIGEDGSNLGIAGVGIDMNDVMEVARYYTDTFGMNVSFLSADGTAYVGPDQASISEAHRDVSAQGEGEPITTMTLHGCIVSRYVPLIGWYLAVENDGREVSDSMFGLIGLSVVLLAASLAIIAALNSRMFSRERRELTHRANTDALTGLLNRAGLEEKAGEYLALEEGERKACLIAIDVDNFKEVNDTFGHAIGDQILCEVAQALRSVFRESDILSRPGGDEFSAFLPAMEQGEALERRAHELLERGRLSYKNDDGSEVGVTLSFGIALAPQNGTTFDELSLEADAALYAAKRAGRDCYRFA